MRRGDLYWADLVPRSGSEQGGRRPVVVITHDAFNQTSGWRSVTVVPISISSVQTRLGPTVVRIPSGTAGLARAGFALCHLITTLDRAKLSRRIGMLPPELVEELEAGMKAALDLD